MKTIAFAGSNSSTSINQQFINIAATLVEHIEVIKLTDYTFPIYNIDIEEKEGIPKEVQNLDQKLSEATNFIISVPEHNGNISAFFKNSLDWLSRNNRNFLAHKKVVLLSTSPGKGGASSALQIAEKTLPYFGAEIVSTMSLGNFYDQVKNGLIVHQETQNNLQNALSKLNK